MSRLLSIIVNYRTPEMTLRALDSLLREMDQLPGSRAILVDNDSQDGSFDALVEAVAVRGEGTRVEVLQSGHNGGFGFGVNVGIRHAMTREPPPDFVYLLNSDAVIDPGGLESLLTFQMRHPEAAIAGSYIHGLDGEPHCTSFRFPTLQGEVMAITRIGFLGRFLGRWSIAIPWPDKAQAVDWLAGASMLIRRDVIETIGLFDESFFLYYEETDYCRRAALAGFSTWYVPHSSVAHVGGGSTGFKDVARPRARYWFESRRRYFLLHEGKLYLQVSNVCWVLSLLIWRLRRAVQGIPEAEPPRLLRDFMRYSFFARTESR